MRRLRPVLFALLSLAALSACGEDRPGADTPERRPEIEGPFNEAFEVPATGDPQLPSRVASLPPRDRAWFYWWHPDAGGHTLRVEIIATAAPPLTLGATAHAYDEAVPAGVYQGRVEVSPASLSGGAHRMRRGRHEWVPGVYEVRALLDGREFASEVMEVAGP